MEGVQPMILVKRVDAEGNDALPGVPGYFVFDGISLELQRKVSRMPRARPDAERAVLPVPNHAVGRSVTDPAQKLDQAIDLVAAAMSKEMKESGSRAPTIESVRRMMKLNMAASLAISALYDRETHTYRWTKGGRMVVVDRETGEVDNPRGPAEVVFRPSGDCDVIYREQGTVLGSLEEYGAAEQAPVARRPG
jgi:hypothetical protein